MGIQVLPPDVNESAGPFTPVGTDIRFGLAAVRNVGANVVDAIVRCRKAKGAYTDFYDFLPKVDAVVCNKRTIESLIKAGAFDSMGHTRRGLLADPRRARSTPYADVKRNEAIGQFDLFGALGDDGRDRRSALTAPIPARRVGQARPAGVRAGDARPVRLRPPAVRRSSGCSRKAADTTIAALSEEGAVPDGAVGHAGRHPHRRAAADDQAGQARGRRPRWRTWPAASRRCSSPTPTSWSASTSPRTRSWSSRAGSTGGTRRRGSWRWTCRCPTSRSADAKADRADAAGQPVHAAAGRAAQGDPGHPPRRRRGARPAAQRQPDDRAAPGAACGWRPPRRSSRTSRRSWGLPPLG